jgi:LPS-assembly protein
VAKPYRLLPQITVNARQPDLFSTDSAFFGQYTAFVHPDAKVEGQRTVSAAADVITLRYAGVVCDAAPGGQLHHYSLSYPTSGNGSSRFDQPHLADFSVDSGMTFERSSNWFGRDYTQTLEPRCST